MKARIVATRNYRRAALDNIDAAKRAWALDTQAASFAKPTWEDLVPRYLTKKPLSYIFERRKL